MSCFCYMSNCELDTAYVLILFLFSLYTGSSHLKPDIINMKTVTKSTGRFTYFVPVMLLGFRVCSIVYVRATAWFYAHNTGNDTG
jgi:hypothetical protein